MQRRVLNKLIDKILITLIAEKDSQILSKVSDKEREALNKISAAVFYKQKIYEELQSEELIAKFFEKNAPKKAVKFMKFHIEDEGTARSIHKELSNKISKLKSTDTIIFHGTKDTLVPYYHGKKLSQLLNCKLVTKEGYNHNNMITFKLITIINNFIYSFGN